MSGNATDSGGSLEYSPFYLLFSDKEITSILLELQTIDQPITATELPQPVDLDVSQTADLLDFLQSIELVLGTPGEGETERYELNQHHELIRALQLPHMDRLAGDECVAAVLDCYLGKRYLPCLTDEYLKRITGFDDATINAANETLRRLRVIRRGIVLDASDATTDPTPRKGEHQFKLSEEELRDAVHAHAAAGYPAITAVENTATSFSGGETGHTINERHAASDALYYARMALLEYSTEIQTWYEALPASRHGQP